MTEVVVTPPSPVNVDVLIPAAVDIDIIPVLVEVEVNSPPSVAVQVTPPEVVEINVSRMGVPGPEGPVGPTPDPEIIVSETEPTVTQETLWIEVDTDGDIQSVNLVTP